MLAVGMRLKSIPVDTVRPPGARRPLISVSVRSGLRLRRLNWFRPENSAPENVDWVRDEPNDERELRQLRCHLTDVRQTLCLQLLLRQSENRCGGFELGALNARARLRRQSG